MSNLFNNRVARRSAVAALVACVASVAGGLIPAHSGEIVEPIDLVAPPNYLPGETINVQVHTTGGPSSVHIYSNPPGAASYDGTIPGSSATVPVTVNSNVSGDVTLYFSTGGQQVVASSMGMDIDNTAEAPE